MVALVGALWIWRRLALVIRRFPPTSTEGALVSVRRAPDFTVRSFVMVSGRPAVNSNQPLLTVMASRLQEGEPGR